MSEPKFRAWNKLAHKMAIIDALDFALDSYRAHAGKSSGSGHLADIELMQFTGLVDKHGKEIFEGDVLRLGCAREGFTPLAHPETRLEVNYTRGAFNTKEGRLGDVVNWHEVEIVGNIYEHPHLVAQESESILPQSEDDAPHAQFINLLGSGGIFQ